VYLQRLPFDLARSLLWVLVPPLVLGIVGGLVAVRAPELVRRHSTTLLGAFVFMILVAVGAVVRLERSPPFSTEYDRYVPFLFAQAFFVVVCISAVAIARVRTLASALRSFRRPAPWCQEGTVVSLGDENEVAFATFHGWVGGLTVHCRAFALRTKAGLLHVPEGAFVTSPIPTWTTSAHGGESRAVLRAGDHARVAGFIAGPKTGPYRGTSQPVPGSAGLLVCPSDRVQRPWRDVALSSWRTTALYLVIAVAVAVPALLSSIPR